jgi:biofilm PGA synthesis protein PgaA
MDANRSETPTYVLDRTRPGASRMLVLFCFLWIQASLAAEMTTQEQAVQLARSGELEYSIEQLEILCSEARRKTPEATSLRHDLGVVSSWNRDHERAIALLAETPLSTQPEYVLAAYADSQHHLDQFDGAAETYLTWQKRFPENLKPSIGLFYTLMDADRREDAAEQLVYLQSHFDDSAVQFAEAYLARANGDYLGALHHYSKVLESDPDNSEALRGKALTALDLGAPWQAKAIAEQHPGALTDQEFERVLLDTAAFRLRWSTQTATNPTEQISLAKQADLVHQGLMPGKSLDQLNTGDATERALLYDQILALTARYEMAAAIELFESEPFQHSASPEIPTYVLTAAADAYLYLERPVEALTLYQQVLLRESDNRRAMVGTFYAQNDVGNYGDADRVLRSLLSGEPAWIRPTHNIWLENSRYADTVRMNAISPAYWGDYRTALERIDALLNIAPADASARTARANVLRWQNWPRTALEEADRTLAAEPRNPGAQTVRFHTLMDLYRFDEALAQLNELGSHGSFDPGVRNASERWMLHSRPELISQGGYAKSDGKAIASDEWILDTYLYSSPFRTNFRLFAHDLIRKAEFVEGTGRDHRLGSGAEYRHSRIRLAAELSGGFEDNTDPGLSLNAEGRVTDPWLIGGQLSLNSINVPLRATRVGIRGNELSLTATHIWHERRTASLTGTVIDMDDGNLRQSLTGSYVHSLLTHPRQQVDGRINVYTSRNSGGDRIYFNPEQDRSISVGIDHRWLVYTRYDRALSQTIGVDIGNYWQRNFGGGTTWTLRLEHDWRLSKRLSLSYDASTGVRIYDGDEENVAALSVTLRSLL